MSNINNHDLNAIVLNNHSIEAGLEMKKAIRGNPNTYTCLACIAITIIIFMVISIGITAHGMLGFFLLLISLAGWLLSGRLLLNQCEVWTRLVMTSQELVIFDNQDKIRQFPMSTVKKISFGNKRYAILKDITSISYKRHIYHYQMINCLELYFYHQNTTHLIVFPLFNEDVVYESMQFLNDMQKIIHVRLYNKPQFTLAKGIQYGSPILAVLGIVSLFI